MILLVSVVKIGQFGLAVTGRCTRTGAKPRQRTLEDAPEDGTLNVGDIAAWLQRWQIRKKTGEILKLWT